MCLRLLLDTLIQQAQEIHVLGKLCRILVCNNASTDGTTEYLNELRHVEGIDVINHVVNCGGDANILFCFQAAESKYVWIVGDDDVPLQGALVAIIECLERDEPDLLYLPQLWVNLEEVVECANIKINSKQMHPLSNMGLAVHANVYVTFISAWVVNLDSYYASSPQPKYDRFRGTSFNQLEWNLTLIKQGHKLMCAKDIFLVCRGGSSGGYSLFEVFSTQYNQIIKEKLFDNQPMYYFFRNCMLWCFIPGLIWGARKNTIGNFNGFDKEKTMTILKNAYGGDKYFTMIVKPIILSRRPLAWCFRGISRVFGKIFLYSWKRKVALT
jgi:glycosyltransferase involved in cell wall biosynthesis